MAGSRVNTGILAPYERPAVVYLVQRVPRWCSPDHLTTLALFGAALASAGLICCRFSGGFLPFVFVGLILNWFGDSLDGALARYRRQERERIGFLIDRSSDVLSFSCMIVALGFSGYMTPMASLMLLAAYLLHVCYTLMRLVVEDVQLIGCGFVGATEGRVLIALCAILGQAAGGELVGWRIHGAPAFDIAGGCLLAGAMCLFAHRISSDLRRLDPRELAQHPSFASRTHEGERATIMAEHQSGLDRGRSSGRGQPLASGASLVQSDEGAAASLRAS